jgi:protein gp37
MNEETAKELTEALDAVGAGLGTIYAGLDEAASGWERQMAPLVAQGIHKQLGVSRREWCDSRREALGERVRELVENRERRQKAVAALTEKVENGGDGLSNRQAADVLGVSDWTVGKDKQVQGDLAPAEHESEPVAESEDEVRDDLAPASKRKPTITLYTYRGDPVEYPEPKDPTFNATPGEGISWAQWSWNPVTGCEHGCEYCYAREIATSGGRMTASYPVGFTPLFHTERLDAPAQTSVPKSIDPVKRRVFVCSMADLYGRWVPKEWIEKVHASEIENPQWTYIHLTKFPKRYLEVALPPTGWIGASVDEQKRVKSTEDAFRRIDGVAVKWLSLEPLRGPLEFSDLSMFDWVVIGAQTETRQPGPDGTRITGSWALSLRHGRRAVAFT